MVVQARLLTAEEFAQLPDDGTFQELVRGKVISMPPPGYEHGETIAVVVMVLGDFVRPQKLGRLLVGSGYVLERGPDTVRAPDVAFIRTGRIEDPPPRGYPELVPDLVVEVASPSDRPRYIRGKIDDYFRAGGRLVWYLYPSRRAVDVHQPGVSPLRLGPDDDLDGGEVLPGFRCRVADLFPR